MDNRFRALNDAPFHFELQLGKPFKQNVEKTDDPLFAKKGLCFWEMKLHIFSKQILKGCHVPLA
jgi:hypothetical protein